MRQALADKTVTVTTTMYSMIEPQPSLASGQIVAITFGSYVTTIAVPFTVFSSYATKPITLPPVTPVVYPASHAPSLTSFLSTDTVPTSRGGSISTQPAVASPPLSAPSEQPESQGSRETELSVTRTKPLESPVAPIPVSAEHSASAALVSISTTASLAFTRSLVGSMPSVATAPAVSSSPTLISSPTIGVSASTSSAIDSESSTMQGASGRASSATRTRSVTSAIANESDAASSTVTSELASNGGMVTITTGGAASSTPPGMKTQTASSSSMMIATQASSTAAPNKGTRAGLAWGSLVGSLMALGCFVI
ncbi:MAG: hypothetical protein MMC23_009276 [Stictis urceolatum]|nr:hypothetical protein [Stictis urceolata]